MPGAREMAVNKRDTEPTLTELTLHILLGVTDVISFA